MLPAKDHTCAFNHLPNILVMVMFARFFAEEGVLERPVLGMYLAKFFLTEQDGVVMVKHLYIQSCLLILLTLAGCSFAPTRPTRGRNSPLPKAVPPVRSMEEITAGMVLIPGGDFWMGCDSSKKGPKAAKQNCSLVELPLHRVYLDSYYIDRTEVTVGAYLECLQMAGCSEPIRIYSDSSKDYFYNPKYRKYPVIFVTWFQALDYCTWAGKRLPSEAEWEKAARGPESTRIFPWGNRTPDCQSANIKLGWKGCTGDVRPVGSYAQDRSLYGVEDMAGNVREWINDWYDPAYYRSSPENNPRGPQDGIFVVMRGGRFDNAALAARTSARRTIGPNDYGAGIGFRCVVGVGDGED